MTDLTFKKTESTVEDLTASTQAKLLAVFEKAATQARTENAVLEMAEPRQLWNLYAIGPFHLGGTRPSIVNAQQVIRQGEVVAVQTVMIVRRNIASLNLPYEIGYHTGNLDTWQNAPTYSTLHRGTLRGVPLPPDLDFLVTIDTYQFKANEVGCFEMNICARLTSCTGEPSEFGGFVRVVDTLDSIVPWPPAPMPGPVPPPEPRFYVGGGVRFMVYPA